MLTCKKFLEESYKTISNPKEDPDFRMKLVLLRETMKAVPFWRRERVWNMLNTFLHSVLFGCEDKAHEPSEEAEQNGLD